MYNIFAFNVDNYCRYISYYVRDLCYSTPQSFLKLSEEISYRITLFQMELSANEDEVPFNRKWLDF